MAMNNWRSEVRLTTDIEADEQRAAEEPSNDRPFVIVVVGDFRSAADSLPRHKMGPPHNRRLLEIDREIFHTILARFNVRREGILESLPGLCEAGMLLSAHQTTFTQTESLNSSRLRSLNETRWDPGDASRFEAVAAEAVKWAQPTTASVVPPPAAEPSGCWTAFGPRRHQAAQTALRPCASGCDRRMGWGSRTKRSTPWCAPASRPSLKWLGPRTQKILRRFPPSRPLVVSTSSGRSPPRMPALSGC